MDKRERGLQRRGLWVSMATVVCTVIIAGLAAYGFARYPFPGSRIVFLVLLGAGSRLSDGRAPGRLMR